MSDMEEWSKQIEDDDSDDDEIDSDKFMSEIYS